MVNNNIVVSGRIVHIRRYPRGNALVTVTSKAGKIISPSFRVQDGMWEKLRDRNRVRIEGHIETFIQKGDEKKRRQIFVADKIEKEPTLTEQYFGVKGKFCPDMYARALVSGTVASVTDTGDGWVHYTVMIDNGEGKHPYWIRINQRKTEYAPIYKKDDEICAVCGISTSEKEKDEHKIYFEDLIVTDIALAKPVASNPRKEPARVEIEPIF